MNNNSSNNKNTIGNVISNQFEQVKNTISNATNKIKNITSGNKNTNSNKSIMNKILPSSNNNSNNGSGFFSRFSSNSVSDFAEKNSTITKFVFILFVFVVFVLLLRIGSYILTLLFTPKKNPIVLNGMVHGNSYKKIQVNPSKEDPKPIFRSINEDQGMEFTWNTWVIIEDVYSGDPSKNKRIFSKGGEDVSHDISLNGTTLENNYIGVSPGLFLKANTNTLIFVLNAYDESSTTFSQDIPYETIEINNIPLQKWVCCTFRVQHDTIDVYINGVLTRRVQLQRVPRQNYGNIHVGDKNNGINGYISSLRYFNYAIGNGKIQEIVQQGPNTKMIGSSMESSPPYLSMNWYFDPSTTHPASMQTP